MARYNSVRERNKDRDELIKLFYRAHKNMSYQEIADKFHLKSRQHAFSIIHGDNRKRAKRKKAALEAEAL